MSAKTSAEVVIDGKVYTLSGYEGEEYLQKVASYTAITTHAEHFAHKFPSEPQFHRTGHNSSVFYTFYIVKADAYDIY